MAEYPDPASRNVLEPGCERCPALAASRECISWGNGALDADVFVVGEAPAFGEPDADRWRGGNWTGMAYTSRHSGQRVRELFADAGVDSGALYVTNAVKCFPASESERTVDGDPTNREPTAEERANCRTHLLAEIEQVDPTVVAATGKHATLSVLGADEIDGGFLDSVLEPVESPEFDGLDRDLVVLPLLHPSYQNVWLPRIGHDRESYVAAIRDEVDAALEST